MTRRYLSFGGMVVLVIGLTVGCRYEALVADQTEPAENGAVAVPVAVETVALTVEGMT
jgi:hypothetical protein